MVIEADRRAVLLKTVKLKIGERVPNNIGLNFGGVGIDKAIVIFALTSAPPKKLK
jgi:hypothetical protein